MQVGNLKRFVQRTDQAFGGLVAPPAGGTHYFESILTVGPAEHFGFAWDTITSDGGEPWIEQSADDSSVTLLRGGIYTFLNWGFDFRAGATPFTQDQTVRVFLDHDNAVNGGPQFAWQTHKVTAEQVTNNRASNTENNGPSHTAFFEKGSVVKLGSGGTPAGATSAMELYVFPVAFSG